MKYTGNTPFGLRQTDHSSSGIFSAGVERITIGANGNIGIGTTSPIAKLHVQGAARVDSITFTGKGFLATSATGINLESVNDDITLTPYRNTIISSGNVGIGTSTPGYALDVQGAVSFASPVHIGSVPSALVTGSGTLYIAGSKLNITSTGNVGIGTTAPSDKLHIVDSDAAIRLQDSDGTDQWSRIRQAGSNLLLTSRDGTSNGQIYFQQYDGTTTTDAMVIRSSGRVGIGTSSPSNTLHVNSGGVNAVARFTSTDGGAFIEFEDDSSTNRPYIGAVGNNLDIRTGGNVSVKVKEDGNVGIGTSTPLSKLHVDGNTRLDGTLDIYGSYLNLGRALSTAEATLTIGQGRTDNGYSYIDLVGDATYTDYGARLIRGNNGPNANTQLNHRGTGALDIQTVDAAPIKLVTSAQERVRVTSDGKVGIGITSPSAKFHLFDTNSAVGGLYESPFFVQLTRSSTGGSPSATYFTKDQYTLAGTDSYNNSLGKQLHAYISSTGTATNFRNLMSRVHTTSAGAASTITHYATHLEASGTGTIDQWYGMVLGERSGITAFQNSNATINHTYGIYLGSLTAGTQTNDPYAIYQGGTEKIYLQGNVGIGTDSPTSKLHVAGTFKSVGINDSASAQAIFINGNGEVGIGTTNQTTTLDIGGVFQFSTASDLLQINNNTNTGGINLSGGNSRIYFGNNRAIEGAQDGTNLVLGEGYSSVRIHNNATLVANGNISASGDIRIENNKGLVSKNVAGADRTLIKLDSANVLRIKGNDSEGSSNAITMVAGGDVNFPANVTVEGILTAQEFHTEFVSSSIIYESGSTKFGDTSDDIHAFTGTLRIHKDDPGLFTPVDALVIRNFQMGSAGPNTNIRFTDGTNDYATIFTGHSNSRSQLGFQTGVLSSSLQTQMLIDGDGNVGIGTVTPSSKLHVAGEGIGTIFTVDRDSRSNGYLDVSFESQWTHLKTYSNQLFYVDTQERLRITGTGLEVTTGLIQSQNNANIKLKPDGSGNLYFGDAGKGMNMYHYSTTLGEYASYQWTAGQYSINSGAGNNFALLAGNDFIVNTNGLNRFVVDQNGKVGIGTTTPSASHILDVAGAANFQGIVEADLGILSRNKIQISNGRLWELIGDTTGFKIKDGSANGTRLSINTGGFLRLHQYGAGVLTTDSQGNVLISTTYLDQATADTRYVNVTGDTMTGSLTVANGSATPISIVGTSTNYTALAIKNTSSGASRVYFDAANGDLSGGDYSWVGQNNDLNLEIANSINAGRIVFTESGGERMTISSGNVGIGTTSPASRLEVRSDDTDGQVIISRASNPDQKLYLRSGIGSGEARVASQYSLELKSGLGGDPNYDLTLATGTGEAMRIDGASNNVGIGTASPQRPLDVNGDIQNNGVLRRAGLVFIKSDGTSTKIGPANSTAGDVSIHSSGTLGTGDQLAVFKSSGNVGIGTTSPTAKLHVDGDIKAQSGALFGDSIQILRGLNASSLYKAGFSSTGAYGTPTLLTGYDNSNILQQRDGKQFTDLFGFGNRVMTLTTIGGKSKVGIGITDPTNTLEVAGPIEIHSQMPGEAVSVTQQAGYNEGAPAGTRMLLMDVDDNILGAFVDYIIYDNGRANMRSGTLQVVFNGLGEVRFTDNSTTDIGDTSPAYFQAVAVAPTAEIKFVAPDATWHIRYHVRYL